MRKIVVISLVMLAAVIAFIVAGPTVKIKPEDPHWGKTNCSACRMAINSPRFAAQILGPGGRRSFYDDLGCAMKDRLEKPELSSQPLYVNISYETENSQWVEAPAAQFSKGLATPMGYGVAVDAHGTLDWAEVQEYFSNMINGGNKN